MYQIIIINKHEKVAEWGGSANFASKSYDSVVTIVSRVHQALNTLI